MLFLSGVEIKRCRHRRVSIATDVFLLVFVYLLCVLFLFPRQDENRIESSKQSTEAG